jgi:branched-chain amino acid transport system ATP-binding protein
MAPLLAVENLRAGYDETEVLRGVSFDVDRGEVVSLVGRNGVGKTTTLRTIAGSVPAWGGSVTYDGDSLVGLDPSEVAQRGIALVPEERRVFPGLTVAENLRMGQLGGGGGRTVASVLDTFDSLAERAGNQAAQLSGGEQQMLAIARALLTDPDLLLLDEPTEGLAPIIVERVQHLVADLNDDGLTVLLVEQNVQVAMSLADRHYILDRGEVVYTGTTADLESDQDVLDRHLGVSAE